MEKGYVYIIVLNWVNMRDHREKVIFKESNEDSVEANADSKRRICKAKIPMKTPNGENRWHE